MCNTFSTCPSFFFFFPYLLSCIFAFVRSFFLSFFLSLSLPLSLSFLLCFFLSFFLCFFRSLFHLFVLSCLLSLMLSDTFIRFTLHIGPTYTFAFFFSDTALRILKIVGICLGALTLLSLVIASCIVCYKKTHNQAQPGVVIQGTDNSAHVAEDTRKQTTSF